MPRLFVTAERRAAEQFESLRRRSRHHFMRLPILVLDTDATEAAELRACAGLHVYKPPFDSYLPLLQHADQMAEGGKAGRVGNVSVSYGPGRLDPYEPVTLATRIAAASGCVLVVATGNDGPGEASISGWARAPWVVGVGATTCNGGALLLQSSIGAKGDGGPLVVAHGEALVSLLPNQITSHGTMVALILRGKEGVHPERDGYVDTRMVGTSVATPRVARVCELLVCLMQVIHGLNTMLLADLPPSARLSDFLAALARLMAYDRIDVPDRPLLHGLPIVAMAPVLMLLQDCALSGAPLAAPASDPTRGALEPVTTIRRMLASMAAPVPGHEPHQVGAGFVSDAIAKAWISSLRPAQLLRMLCGTEQAVPKRLSADEPVIGARLLGEIDRRRAGLGLIDRPIL